MSVRVKTRQGKEITLLNPAEKAAKAAAELRDGVRYTNDGQLKTDKNGVVMGLDEKQRAYRAGMLAMRRDEANCYKAKKRKKESKNLPALRG